LLRIEEKGDIRTIAVMHVVIQ